MLKKFRKVLLSCTSLMMLIGNTNIFVNAEDTESSDAQIKTVEDEKEDETIEDTIDDSSNIAEWKYEDDEITVTVETQIDALPENSELFVTKLDAEKVDELQNEDAEEAVGYDIGFTNEGEEVEPTSEAQVNIQLKTETLGEDIDVDSVNVKHIKDDENVDTVANKEKENISEENGVINTTFTTESFSYFIINYNNNYKIYAHLIDTEGTEFPASASDQLVVTGQYDQANFYNWNRKENIWVEVKTLVATYGEFTNGYTYQSTHVGSADGTEIKWIYYSTSRSGSRKANTWYYSTSDTRPTSNPTSSTPTIAANSSVYCIYTKDYESDAEIQDTVHENGSLFLPRPEGISDTAEVTYKWYRSTEKNGTYTYAKRQKIAGSGYTVVSDETGTRLYPALDVAITDEYLADQSVRFWYKVEVYVDGELYETTGSVQNQYYISLQNGSFENIDTQLLNKGQAAAFIPEGTTGLSWKTTGTDHQVEVVYAPSASSAYGVSTAPDGNQFAELNAEAQGALYQDVMSTPNTGLYWKIYHRARSGTDTMYLIIAPTNLVEDITTQAKLSNLASEILADPEGYAEKGYYIQTITDGTSAWGQYSGTYDVPDDVYLTRLFFVSATNSTVGNFIDAVAFSNLMPEPDAGYGNLTVSKTVSGILDTDIKKYQVKVDVTNTTDGTSYSKILDFSKATKSDDGTYTLNYSLVELTAGTNYTVTETVLTDMSNLSVDYETLGSTCSVNGTDISFNGTTTVTITEGTTNTVNVENKYKPSNSNLVINNTVTGNLGNKDKPFEYNVTITDTDGNTTTETFTLSNSESKTISVPYGAKVVVEQTDYSSDGYSTYYTEGEDETHQRVNTITIESQKDNETINFVNTRKSSVPTGTHVTNDPNYILLGLGFVMLISLIFKLRKGLTCKTHNTH